ncbi:MAG: TVP38/TMEM64 family protein [Eggerthellaceae bacterium]|nr:TVP38/TMEM64 family protein [Eggerthellaceae bacterium]
MTPKKAVEQRPEEQSSESQKPRVSRANIFKLCGLGAFFVILVVVVILIWPLVGGLFEEGGLESTLQTIREAGPTGVLILEGLQFLQIVVAFIPGEITQIAAGMLYGPWLGSLVIIIGCIISSAFIYFIVHKLGAPFVQEIVPTKYWEKFNKFDQSGKLNILVFILFLIPGLPKDTFTYLVPLTTMKMSTYLILSNLGRIPGIFVSAYAADAFASGYIWESIAIFAAAAIICIAGILLKDRIMAFIDKKFHKEHTRDTSEDKAE